MPATISPEPQRTQHRTPEQHPRAEADYSADDFLSSEALEERYLHNAAPSEGFIGAAGYYARFLELPAAVVVAVLWLAGMALLALLSSCVVLLYVLGTSLARVVAGA
jgi:hypothetical protein